MRCPECNGKGHNTYKRGYKNYFGDVVPDFTMGCVPCNATGEVDPDYYARFIAEENRFIKFCKEREAEGCEFAPND